MARPIAGHLRPAWHLLRSTSPQHRKSNRTPLRRDQLNGLVASLAEQYQRGDLENLLALFDASARMERGDKKQIRAEYGELFRNSESRALHIWDMAWSGDGKVTRGEGSFQARVLRKGDPLTAGLQRRGHHRSRPAQRQAADRRPVSQGGSLSRHNQPALEQFRSQSQHIRLQLLALDLVLFQHRRADFR